MRVPAIWCRFPLNSRYMRARQTKKKKKVDGGVVSNRDPAPDRRLSCPRGRACLSYEQRLEKERLVTDSSTSSSFIISFFSRFYFRYLSITNHERLCCRQLVVPHQTIPPKDTAVPGDLGRCKWPCTAPPKQPANQLLFSSHDLFCLLLASSSSPSFSLFFLGIVSFLIFFPPYCSSIIFSLPFSQSTRSTACRLSPPSFDF